LNISFSLDGPAEYFDAISNSLMAREVHLYFHSPCFDGAVSAAMASDYLERIKGYSKTHLHGINYDIRSRWLTTRLERDPAVVDFLYHPKVILWADHHSTTFLNHRVKRDYQLRRGPEIVYDKAASSCAKLLYSRWRKSLYPFLTRYREPVFWADRIDSARYESVAAATQFHAPALQINLALAVERDGEFSINFVRLLRSFSLSEIAARPEFRSVFRHGQQLQHRGTRKLRQCIRLTADQKIAVFDLDADAALVNRYAPFLVFPDARYSAGIVRSGGEAKLTTMRNPWKKFPSAPLGEICVELGGGGHRRVGSAIFRDGKATYALDHVLKKISAWERRKRVN
jgi:hypothetical protein